MKLLSTPLYSFISFNHLTRNRRLFFQFLKTIAFASFIFLGNIHAQTVIYVDSSKASSGVGTSWATAYKTLKEATIISNNNPVIKEIRIAKGTYFPTTNTNRDSTFLISRGDIRLYGGYPTGGGVRNHALNPTILSGDIGTIGTQTDNSYHVMVIAGLAAGADSVIIEGLNIRWGRASDNGNFAYNGNSILRNTGGGIFAYNNANGNKTTIRNCTISANYASDAGAGMCNTGSATLIVNCLFSGNFADYGGGMINGSSPVSIINCTFAGNYAGNSGAAIRNSSSNPTITNTIMYGNNGGISNNNSTPVITYSLVQGLTATTNGNLNGNTNNPLFVTAIASGTVNVDGDYRLQSSSPCINKGIADSIPAGIETDLGGNLRYHCILLDMGAYESGYNPIRYVKAIASGTGSGNSWANASGDLQLMINQSSACSEIWVASGTYKPNRPADNLNTIDANNRYNAFVLKADVKIFGGFPATGNPTMAQRNWNTNVTILSGDIGTVNIISDNSYHVIISSGAVGTAELNGFTITKGNASEGEVIIVNNNNVNFILGGGMYNVFSSPTISNCIFSGNTANIYGGGMSNKSSSPMISNSTFSGNFSGSFGGGMSNETSSPIIYNSTFSGNTVDYGGGGGGLSNSYFSFPRITNSIFSGNKADYGGGMINDYSTSPIISNSIFYGNSSRIYSEGTSSITYSIIEGGYAGIGNLDIDPLFVNAPSYTTAPFTEGDYSLQSCSPAINVGNNAAISVGITTDIIGNPRIYATTVDMGAYEYQSPKQFAPIITAEPINVMACLGSATSFSVTATNTTIYQWQVNTGSSFANINNNATYSGASTATLNINNVTAAMSAYTYRVIAIGNCQPNDTSETVTLSVANIRYVKQDGTGNGLSWANASGDLQLMINQACPNSEIWVAEGTYLSNGTGFVLKNDLKIYGGFSNTGTPVFVDRNPKNYPSILSGDNARRVFYNNFNSANSLTSSAVLDGFTIKEGNSGNGAGMYNANASPILRSLIFINNNSTGNGGAMYNAASSPLIIDCQFIENSANNGGAVSNASISTPRIVNSLFVKNTATSGGAIFANNASSYELINSTVYNNTAATGGGLSHSGSTTMPMVKNSIIYGNGQQVRNASSAITTIEYSLIEGGYTGTGNLDANPLFVNTSSNYSLMPCSPAINAGKNTVIPAGVLTDIEGNPRIYESTVDMGAYEYQSPKPLAPIITTEPVSSTICLSSGASFSVIATNVSTYQWQVDIGSGFNNLSNAVPYSGVATATLNISNSTVAMNGYTYRVIAIGNCQPNDTSEIVSLSVANIRYVKQGGTGNGTSWANASGDLQLMINQACPNSEIWVASGTYKPNRPADNLNTIDANNRNNAFVLKADVKIYGGFPNTGNPDTTQRDWTTYITTLSGDIGIANDSTDNCYHVVISSGSVGAAELNGFTITKGNANVNTSISVNGTSIEGTFGGGMYNDNSSLTISNCTFSGNIANYGGGGMHNSFASPTISNSIFSGNKADFGSGINNDNSSPLISNSTISGNFSTEYGGGMHNTFSSPTIINSIFYGNSLESLNNSNASFSIIQGGFAGIGNLDINPLFVNAPSYTTAPFTGGNYRLQPCSPAINVGNNTLISSGIITDIAGNPRIYESTVDMGAYEYQSPNSLTPIITTEPINATVCLGSTTFSITATNATTYQWQENTGSGFNNLSNTAIYSGVATAMLNISNSTSDMNGYTYRCIAIGCTNDTSDIVSLSVANIRYVKQDGTGDGTSWTNASGDLQLMINQACPNSEIWVAQGTYKPNRPADNLNTIDTNNRNNAFVLKADVKIYGGFPNTGNPDTTHRDWATYPTILSGDIGTIDNVNDNCYHVVISAGEVGTAELNGFTITKGKADGFTTITVNGYNLDGKYGGGMYNDNSSPIITNSTFSGNTSNTNGGGMYNDNSSPIILNSNFSENSSSIGGGMYNASSSLTITNSVFLRNIGAWGAGMYNSSSSPTISNSTFLENTATLYGGGMYNSLSSPTITNNTFSGNTTPNIVSGGMYNSSLSYPTISNSIFYENSSAILTIGNGTPAITYSIIQGGYTGIGNLDINPLFVNTALGDYRLQACSPAINAGNNTKIPTGITTDIAGNPRIYETTVDMGAYENVGYSLQELANTNLTANGNCNSSDGWMHYYTKVQQENKIVVSINSHGQDLGAISAASILTDNYDLMSNQLFQPYGQVKTYYPFNRSWSVESPNTFNQPVSVRFYFSGNDSSDIATSMAFGSLQNLTLYKVNGTDVWNIGATNYKEYTFGQVADTEHYTLGTYRGIQYAEFQVNSFSTGTMAMTLDESILPLDLISFTASAIENEILLHWKTVNEVNVSHFEIERSTDGINWEIIQTTTATNGIEQNYTAWDNTPLAGTNYYRLKMIDIDGAYKYSKIVEVTFGGIENVSNFQIYPNPNHGSFVIKAKGLGDEILPIKIYDNMGRVIHQSNIKEGLNSVNLKNLISGMYYLNIENATENKIYKIIIE